METVAQVAVNRGTETAVRWADHRIEALEAEIRSNLQALRALSEAVLRENPQTAVVLARSVRELLAVKQTR